MSRTRELEFWIEPDDIEALTMKADNSSVLRLYARQDSVSKNGQMVKLIQTLPERKVTIPESEFEQIWSHTRTYEEFKKYKDALFKDAE